MCSGTCTRCGCGRWPHAESDRGRQAQAGSDAVQPAAIPGVLRGLAATPREAFLGNADKIGNAKYHIVIAVECCIDIANHVIASENYRFPRDNADSFAVLVAEGILPGESREPLEAMARVRNRLVHLYWDVDDPRIHDYLQEGFAGSTAATSRMLRTGRAGSPISFLAAPWWCSSDSSFTHRRARRRSDWARSSSPPRGAEEIASIMR